MTSKEIMQDLIKTQKKILFDNRNCFSREMKLLYANDLTNYNHVLKDLKRLEAIDNANPSEALNSLEYICKILNEKRIDIKWLFEKEYNTIKQALLKAQEQEKVLETVKADLIIELYNKKNAIEMFKQERISREKQDKILRIIKEKNVDIKQLKHFIQCYTKEVSLKTYNDYHNSKEELTQEEYDLFEEWLDNGKD